MQVAGLASVEIGWVVKECKVKRADVQKIAEAKMVDLNANDLAAAMRIVEGSARSMGLIVVG